MSASLDTEKKSYDCNLAESNGMDANNLANPAVEIGCGYLRAREEPSVIAQTGDT